MINRKQLESLIEHRNAENPIISLYLNVELPKKLGSELNSLIRRKNKELESDKRYSSEEKSAIEQLLAEIEREMKGRKNFFPGTKMVAFFADTRGFRQEFELPVQFPNRLIIDENPYTKPLTAAHDQFSRFCLLVSNSRKARILTLQAHQLIEEREVFVEEESEGSTNEALKGFG